MKHEVNNNFCELPKASHPITNTKLSIMSIKLGTLKDLETRKPLLRQENRVCYDNIKLLYFSHSWKGKF